MAFGGLPPEVINKVVEKFVFQLEAQLADRGVSIELTDAATKWIAEKGYDEKFGARPLARVIQEHIKKPLAEELLFGKLEHGGTVRIGTQGEGGERTLAFEYFPADPAKKPKARDEEDDEEMTDEGEALVGATPKKALPGPKAGGKEPSRPIGTVPSVPRRKKDE